MFSYYTAFNDIHFQNFIHKFVLYHIFIKKKLETYLRSSLKGSALDVLHLSANSSNDSSLVGMIYKT